MMLFDVDSVPTGVIFDGHGLFLYDDLSVRDKLSLSEKMRLKIIKQTLSRHSIRDKSDFNRLAAENRELTEQTSALKTELEGCHNLKKAYQEIRDTYTDISKGEYISKLIENNRRKVEDTLQKKESYD